MIEIRNQFARHLMLWVLTLPFLSAFLMPAFFPLEAMKIPATEHETLVMLGQNPQDVTQRASKVFSALFVDSGVVAMTQKIFKSRPTKIGGESERNTGNKAAKYREGFWNLIYKAIWRFMGMWPVLSVLLLAFVVPAMVDGLVTREMKIDQFRPHNPVFFWGASHSVIMIAGGFMFMPFLPLPITVPILYGAVALVALGMWTTTANLQIGT